MRSPAAVARCAWPIHMPSMRSGITSISTRKLKKKKSVKLSWPLTTMRPPTRITAACAMSGRNESTGT